MPNTPRTIVWDFNGTLLDDVRACLDALNVILRANRISPLTAEDYRARFRFPVADFYRELGMVPATPFDWEALGESFHMRYLFSRHLRLQDGAREALLAFRAAGLRQGILSALEQGILEMQLRQFGLTPHLDFIRGSRNYDGASKEDAARGLNLQGPVLLVGDTLHPLLRRPPKRRPPRHLRLPCHPHPPPPSPAPPLTEEIRSLVCRLLARHRRAGGTGAIGRLEV